MTTFKTLTDEISDQFLACKICLETYKKPKTLSCLHTFCTSCLEGHLESEQERTNYRFVIYNRSITCPICRGRTEVPSGGIRNLPDNFLVSNLTEVINRSKPSSKSPVCDICTNYKKRTRNAVSKCLECSKFLCRNCVDLHKKTKVTKGHNIFDVEVEKNVMCKCHDDEPVRFFCQPCETCICVLCTFQEHVGHEVASFGEGIIKYVGNVQSLLKMGKSKMSFIQNHLDVMNKCEKTIASVEEKVNKLSTTFLMAIRAQQKQVIDEIRQFYGSEALEILDNKDELEQIMSNLKSTCGLAELILENRNIELLLLQKEIKGKMKTLVNVELPDLPESMGKEVKFVEGSFNIGRLETGFSDSSHNDTIPEDVLDHVCRSAVDSRDASTMTWRNTKDRGICTDPYIQRPMIGNFVSRPGTKTPESSSSDIASPDKDSSGDDRESTFRRILQRRPSLQNVFRDNEKFFNSGEEEGEEDNQEVDGCSSTILELSEDKVNDQAGSGSYETSVFEPLRMKGVHGAIDSSGVCCDKSEGEEDNDCDSESYTETERYVREQISADICKDNTLLASEHEWDAQAKWPIKNEEASRNRSPLQQVSHRDAAVATEDIEIIQHYSELLLESDGGQTLSNLDEQASFSRETMAEFNVQRLSAGNLLADLFKRRSSTDAPWHRIQDMHHLPVQTEDKGTNVPEVKESDSSLEIEFIDVMLRDRATSTDSLDKVDEQTMTESTEESDSLAIIRKQSEGSRSNALIKSESLEHFTQAISDGLAMTSDTKKGLLELADGFYDINDLAEFTLIETDNAIKPDGTILYSKTIQLSDCGTETDAEPKVEMTNAACGATISMQDVMSEAIAEMADSSTSTNAKSLSEFSSQTTAIKTAESETMTEQAELKDSSMLTDKPVMMDGSCATDTKTFCSVATETRRLEVCDIATGSSVEMMDIGCGDSVATVADALVNTEVEMVDSCCSPLLVSSADTCLQTEGWDFKDAYVDTDSIDVRDIFTDMPQLQLMDVFTNTSTPQQIHKSTCTDVTQLEHRGSETDVVKTSIVGTLTDLLEMCDVGIGTVPIQWSDAATEIMPENVSKETMTPIIDMKDVSTSARFRRKKPAKEDAGTSTVSVELADSGTTTFTETSSISISPETSEEGTETQQLCLVDAQVEALPDLVDTGTIAFSVGTRDMGSDPVQPQMVDVGINTYIISLAPRKRDASTTTARTMEEITQELETVALKNAAGGNDATEEPPQPRIDSDLLGQKIGELFSLSKLQNLTEKLARDRQKIAEARTRKHVLPTARMLEKRLSIDESQPFVSRRRLSSQRSIDNMDEEEATEIIKESGQTGIDNTKTLLEASDVVMVTNKNQTPQTKETLSQNAQFALNSTVVPSIAEERQIPVELIAYSKSQERDLLRKKRPNICPLLNLSRSPESEFPLSSHSYTSMTQAESSLDVTPGESPCVTPSGDNLSSFSDTVEPIREKKRKHKKEKRPGKERDFQSDDEPLRKSSSLKHVAMPAEFMATCSTPEEENPKKYKIIKKSFFKLGKFSKSMPTLAKLDEKFDRFFRRSATRDGTQAASVSNTPKTSRAGSPDRGQHRKARPAKVAALLEQTILEKVRSSTSEGESGQNEDDGDYIQRESNV